MPGGDFQCLAWRTKSWAEPKSSRREQNHAARESNYKVFLLFFITWHEQPKANGVRFNEATRQEQQNLKKVEFQLASPPEAPLQRESEERSSPKLLRLPFDNCSHWVPAPCEIEVGDPSKKSPSGLGPKTTPGKNLLKRFATRK